MELKVLNRLRAGKMIAAEMPATSPDRRKWIGVYPLPDEHEFQYRIRVFEVDKKHLVDDNDVWEGTMINCGDYYLNGEEELIRKLSELITDTGSLTNPWDCDYPV